MAISKDGLQINRATAKKGFIERIDIVTVYPDGKMEKDVSPDRPDLLEIAKRISQPLENGEQRIIDYAKLSGDR